MSEHPPNTRLDPGMFDTPGVFDGFTDEDLSWAIAVLVTHRRDRALARCDLDTVVDDAQERGFDAKGVARVPWLHQGLLVCPGSKVDRSASSHDCVFVSVDGTWVWEHPDVLADDVRQLPGPRGVRHTVTVLTAWEGMRLDVVASTARSGPCQMRSARTFQVHGDTLVEIAARARRPDGHR